MSVKRKKRKRRPFMKQRLIGLGMLILSIVAIWFASKGAAIEDRDCTGILVFITIPSLVLLFSKELIIE